MTESMPSIRPIDHAERMAARRRCVQLYTHHLNNCAACASADCDVGAGLWAAVIITAAAERPDWMDEPHPEWIAALLDVGPPWPEGPDSNEQTLHVLADSRRLAAQALRVLQGYAEAVAFLEELEDALDAGGQDVPEA